MKRIISVLLAALTLLLMAACGQQASGSEAQSVVEPKASQMKSICELATMECYYHNVAKSDTMKKVLWWNTDRRLWIEYTGIVKAGVDIDKIDMKVDGNTLTISLPKAEILSCKVDKDSLTEDSYVVEKHGLGAGKITADIQTKTIRTAQENLKKAAKEDNELLSQAEERAKNLITDYVNRMGEATGETYEIKWK